MRLVVERIEGTRVIGWVHDPATPGDERLALTWGEMSVNVTVKRVSRADVERALGIETPLALGFEIELPLSVWRIARELKSAQILVNGVAAQHGAIRPTLKGLVEWINRIAREADPLQRESLMAPLRLHLAEARQWRGADEKDSVLDDVPAASHLEGWQGLSLTGWVADEAHRRESIRLRCQETLLECMVLRTSRRDVAGALELQHDDVGFELEVPGIVWQQFPGAEELLLQVMVGSRPCGEVMRLRRDNLSDKLDAALAMTDPGRRSHQSLLAMEHLVLAGALGDLDHAMLAALRVLAESAGVSDWLEPGGPGEAMDPVEQRPPTRFGPRGRLGRWLGRQAMAHAALSLLAAMKRRPALAPRAEALELKLTQSLGLFDRVLYEDQVPPADRGGLSALRHYVREGDARSLAPMCLFDPRHYTSQLGGRRHPGINRLLHYSLWGRFRELSPSGWFDTAYYSEANRDVQHSRVDPLVHFTTWGWKERRRPYPHFEPTAGRRQSLMQRLTRASAASHADPLINYLLRGLPPDAPQLDQGRLPWITSTQLDGRDHLDLGPWRALPSRPASPVVDVIVPVYAGVQETLRCLWSVLTAAVELPFELVVIDDCSPDPALSACMRELAALGLLKLLVNPSNLGFVGTVNRGMALHPDRDVVLLNADTRVHAGWLDRLAAHGVAEPRAASVTPLSNNATICSYPRTLHSNWERIELDDAALDALAARTNRGHHVIAPTGHGFCMWMRRACIDAVGLFDVERFGRGYGEENDWCMRTNDAGWVQLIAADVYVLHQGSVSFRAETTDRTRAALAVLLERHPDYQRRIDHFIANDPMRPQRARLDIARLRCAPGSHTTLPMVLMVSHARGGGTARHELEQAATLLAEQGVGTAFMRPSRRKGCIALSAPGVTDVPNLDALPLRADGVLLEMLRALDLREVQLHHLADHVPAMRELLPALCKKLGVPLRVTLHDYHMICPRINLVDATGRYCGEPLPAGCDACLQRDGEGRTAGPIVEWRAAHHHLLLQADDVLAPDLDVSHRMGRYFPDVRVQVRPHEPAVVPPAVSPASRPALRHMMVIGALSLVKGYQVLLGLATSEVCRRAGLRFTLLGHSPDDPALRAAGVDVLGRYDDDELLRRIDALQPDLILLPSVWPETYSYVLTGAMASGRRIAVFDLGAPARRLREAGADAIIVDVELAAHPDLLAKRLLKG